MRVDDLKGLVGQHAAQRFLEKRGMSLPMAAALGLQAPGLVDRSLDRYHNVEDRLNRASRQQLDESVKQSSAGQGSFNFPGKPGVGSHLLGGMAGMKDFINPASAKNIALHIGGTAIAGALGAVGASLLKDMYSKAKSSLGSVGNNTARKAIIDQLKKEDPVLNNSSDATLMEAYHTMVRFAPTLSTDKNAVRSFLRQSVMSGAGPDFTTIKLLADSERAVTGKTQKDS